MNAAAAAATPGTTVLIRGGSYTAQFAPAVSGMAGSPITFRNYTGETVTISGSSLDPAIQISNRQYLVIDGFTVSNVGRWLEGTNATNNVIQNCRFNGPVGSFTASSFLDAHHNKFLQNTFTGSSGDSLTLFRSNYNLIQGNTFTDADHSLFSIKCGDFNVVRGNTLSNSIQKISEVFDCDGNEPGVPVNELNSTTRNLIDGNIFSLTPVDDGGGPYAAIQYAGQSGIIRRNIFYDNKGSALDFTLYTAEANNNRSNRAYNNVFYNNTGGGISLAGGSASQFSDNIIKNNIFYQNKRMPEPQNDNIPGGSQISAHTASGYQIAYNNIFNQSAGESGVIQLQWTDRTVAQVQSSNPSQFSNNVELSPGFVNAAGHDFALASNSPMIDRGTFLTVTSQAGSGTSLRVADASYFYDGYGISGEVGDLIQLAGQTQTACVTAIDYASNTLTLSQSLTWSANQGMSLAYNGTAPDMGAFEFGQSEVPPDTTPPLAPKGLKMR